MNGPEYEWALTFCSNWSVPQNSFFILHSNMVAFDNGLFQDHPRKMFHESIFMPNIHVHSQNESENYLENIGNAYA